MQLWRVSRHVTLAGTGGFIVDGRWHTRGRPVVYCSLNPSTALIEWIVHLELAVDDIPKMIPFIVVDVPDVVRAERVEVNRLPPDWKTTISATQALGDAWLESRRSALLYVPSAVLPETENLLINPSHSDATSIRIAKTLDAPFDPRLMTMR